MPDNTSDDVYDDPDNVLADNDDTVNGAVELPREQTDDLSQSTYLPEKDTGIQGEDRGAIDELGAFNDPAAEDADEADAAFEDSQDVDSEQLAGEVSPDERDGTDPI